MLGVQLKKFRKAVFPVAGFGTRFLPATKAMPKELLPIVDKPLIQYAAEEAISAGIDTLIFVTSTNVRLKITLITIQSWKWRYAPLAKIVKPIWLKHSARRCECILFVSLNNWVLYAVLCAERVVGDEPFAFYWLTILSHIVVMVSQLI